MLVLQEADEVIYRSAFAVERTHYKIRTNNGSVRDFGCQYTKTQIVKMLSSIGKTLDVDYTLIMTKVAEDVSHAIQIAKNQIKKIALLGDYQLYISPSDKSNFRFKVAKTPGPRGVGYKAGRPDKPIHYQAVRDYLVTHHGAVEAFGYEADDMLGIYQNDPITACSHIDKDINMIPGKHYNWVTGEKYIVPHNLGTLEYVGKKLIGRGIIFLYCQMLTGDATDNIPGIKGVGIKRAYDLLKDCKTEKEAFDIIKQQYYNQYQELAINVLPEIADLLYIVRADRLTGSQYIESKGFTWQL